MLTDEFRPWHVPVFFLKYAWLTVTQRPLLVNFEVTGRCNARCGFCDYWKTPATTRDSEIASFAEAARYFNPMVIVFTGGEPTLRRDLEQVIAAVNNAVKLKYITLLTHGGNLTPERATSLHRAGVNQFNFSLDYLDHRHDKARGIPGLSQKIMSTIPEMRRRGISGIRFNTVVKRDNLAELMPIVRRAEELGCGVNFSCYSDSKNGNADGMVEADQLAEVDRVVAELLAFKRKRRGVITNSDHYLERMPLFLRGEMNDPCRSGIRTIHLDPSGNVKRCPDFPVDFHWRQFKKYKPIDCNACYYACRGEAQAPLTVSRIRDIMA